VGGRVSDTSQGPGWWQASDQKLYAPELHPSYVAPQPPPPPPPPTGGTGVASATLAPAVPGASSKGALGRLSVTGWLLVGGSVIGALGVFFPWQTISYSGLGIGAVSSNDNLAGGGRFFVILALALAAWVAWPARYGASLSVKRLIGLSVVAALLLGVFILGFQGVSDNNRNNAGSGATFSAGFGLLVYTAAAVAVAIGTIRAWLRRSPKKEQLQP
jgi:hypothetical protein